MKFITSISTRWFNNLQFKERKGDRFIFIDPDSPFFEFHTDSQHFQGKRVIVLVRENYNKSDKVKYLTKVVFRVFLLTKKNDDKSINTGKISKARYKSKIGQSQPSDETYKTWHVPIETNLWIRYEVAIDNLGFL